MCSMLNVVISFEENFGADNDLSSGKRPKMARVAGQNGYLEIALTCSTKDD